MAMSFIHDDTKRAITQAFGHSVGPDDEFRNGLLVGDPRMTPMVRDFGSDVLGLLARKWNTVTNQLVTELGMRYCVFRSRKPTRKALSWRALSSVFRTDPANNACLTPFRLQGYVSSSSSSSHQSSGSGRKSQSENDKYWQDPRYRARGS